MDINVGMMGICLGAPLMLMMFFMKPGGRKLIFFLLMGFVACAVSDRVNIFLMENIQNLFLIGLQEFIHQSPQAFTLQCNQLLRRVMLCRSPASVQQELDTFAIGRTCH